MDRKYLLVCMAVSATLGLGACSNDDDAAPVTAATETPTPTTTPTDVTASGNVIDPFVGAALVCFDVDSDRECDGEMSTNTNAIGQYELTVTESAADNQRIALIIAGTSYESNGGGFDDSFTFIGGPEGDNLTALSTYVEYLVDSGEAADRDAAIVIIEAAFNIVITDGDIGSFNPLANDNANAANQYLSAVFRHAVSLLDPSLSASDILASVLNYVNDNIATISPEIATIQAAIANGESISDAVADGIDDISSTLPGDIEVCPCVEPSPTPTPPPDATGGSGSGSGSGSNSL